jgi:uncharacterized protein YjiK
MNETAAVVPPLRPARRRLRTLGVAFALAVLSLTIAVASASAEVTGVNLATYKRIHRYALPLPPGTSAPPNSLLAEEASGVTYDPANDELYVVGDGGTSVVEVDKEGHLESSMTLAPGGPHGTTFYDTEGIAYVGNEEFVITEERESKLDRFKYVAGGELTRAAAATVVIGEDNDNIGVEGVTNDPLHPNQMIAIKESGPERIYSTEINWATETATNYEGSEGELFPPADAGTLDFSDVYALANVPGISAAEESNLLIISQESGEVVNVSRSGTVHSRLALLAEPSDTISVPDMTNEGVTMDQNGMLYVVDEDGGGSQAHPQLWVYEPQTTADTAPSAVTLGDETNTLVEDPAPLTKRLKVASVTVTDPDGFGENDLKVTGPDAADFEVDHNGLYLKAGTTLNAASKEHYEVSVEVNDPAVGANPDATSDPYKLTVTAAAPSSSGDRLAVTEAAPWSSGNSPFRADWFELTNTGTGTISLAGYKIDDNHNSLTAAVPLEGVPSLAPGKSAVFIEGEPGIASEFAADWFPGGVPSGVQIGTYPEGPGLSTSGDQINIYDSDGEHVAGIGLGTSPSASPFATFENAAALGSGDGPDPLIDTLSSVGTGDAFAVNGRNEIGSPGTAAVPTPVAVTEVAPWGSSWSEYKADWFELTNETENTINLEGWKMDDSSDAFGTAVPLEGVSTLAAGESALFLETESTQTVDEFETSWFGASVPAGLQVGMYHGNGVGLSTGGDGVDIFNAEGAHITGVSFGANAGTGNPPTAGQTFDNAAGLGSYGAPVAISKLSVEGENGAYNAHDQIGSPGVTEGPPPPPDVKITEVDPAGSSASYGSDWFELTNEGTTAVSLVGWRASDSADSPAAGSSGELTGVSSLPAGASAIFLEKPEKTTEFETVWFPGGVPGGFLIGGYHGASGLSNNGDQVNIFDSTEAKITGVSFGAAPTGATFDNAVGIGDAASTPPPAISTASVVGTNGAFTATNNEIGSPGTTKNAAPALPDVKITEVDPSGSDAGYAADWFELTNEGTSSVTLTGWKMTDETHTIAQGGTLGGVTALASGESAVFVEKSSAIAAFGSAWFPDGIPAGVQIGAYEGPGLGQGGDEVNIFEPDETKVTGVKFGTATPKVSFDNTAGIGDATSTPSPTISTLSRIGVDGAFKDSASEIGSPGTAMIGSVAVLSATPVTFPTQAANTIGPGQWVTVTNEGAVAATTSHVKVVEANEELAGDFIVAADHCTEETISPAGTCKVQVRFAPGREDATSNASLVIVSNAQNSPLEVTLSGTSTGLPEGPEGKEGKEGLEGKEGAEGPEGKEGAEGKEGPTGLRGEGVTGATGLAGTAGPTGPQGPAGKNGKNGKGGKDGRDGVVSFTSSDDNAQARRGHDAQLRFVLKNRTAGSLHGATVNADALGTKGSSTVQVATIKAGGSRTLTLTLPVGRHVSLGHHKVQVTMTVGGHNITDTVTVQVTR